MLWDRSRVGRLGRGVHTMTFNNSVGCLAAGREAKKAQERLEAYNKFRLLTHNPIAYQWKVLNKVV